MLTLLAAGAPAAQAQLKQPPPPSQAPQSVWYAVRGPDNAFIVDMPGEPVYKLIDTGSIQRVKIGRRAFITQASVDAFVASLTAA